jgi:hypothetical protein
LGIVRKARNAGELIFEFDQANSAICTQPGPWGDAYSGFCAGMAVKWLALRAQGKDFAFDLASRKLTAPHWHVVRGQNIYEDRDYEDALRAERLRFGAREWRWSGAPSPNLLASVLGSGKGLYLLRFRRAGGGHAAAMENLAVRGGVRFLDANYGEFQFGSPGAFEDWLEGFLVESGYRLRYTAETFVHRVLSTAGGGRVAALRAAFGG